MKNYKFGTVVLVCAGMITSVSATLKSEKVTLKPNMVLKYEKLPSSVNSLSEAFTEGMLYGRLRTNMFQWD